MATLIGVVLAVGLVLIIETTGRSRLAPRLATGAGLMCLVLFVLMNVSDWPGGFLEQFWLDHAIVGATLDTLLLAATIFLAYRYRDQRRQDLIDESIVDAGRSGIVDRVVDLDVALTLLCSSERPALCEGEEWKHSPHGLLWLREHLETLSATSDGCWGEADPRRLVETVRINRDDWHLPLLDQMVRRVSGGVRDWGPILMKSRQGQQDLVAFATTRVALLHLAQQLHGSEQVDPRAALELRRVLRRFARHLEDDGQAPERRPELMEAKSVRGWKAWTSLSGVEKEFCEVLDRIEDHVDRRSSFLNPTKRAKVFGRSRATHQASVEVPAT